MSYSIRAIVLAVVLGATAVWAADEPVKKDAPAGETVEVKVGAESKNTVAVPKAWKEEEPNNRMRLLQFKVPKQGEDSEDSELSYFKFPAGGGVDANIKRWSDIMGGSDSLKLKRTLKTASGVEATVAELEGTYTARTQGNPAPKPNSKMLGAIIVVEGVGEIFVRLVGPKATVEANKAAFDKMVESFK